MKMRKGSRLSGWCVCYVYGDRKANKNMEKWGKIADGKGIKMKND